MNSLIQSVIVLMLENRSFDHMLGYLDHPHPAFPRLTGMESNPREPGAPPVFVSPEAGYTLPLDPGHSHADVMMQLTGRSIVQPPYRLANDGFVYNFEQVGLIKKEQRGFGPLIMQCQPPTHVPVLATLAKSFAVCTHWFSSVPGPTWPNRNFAHAATSDGEADNNLRFYTNRTIFELLADAGREWAIYHDDASQAWTFPQLWADGGTARFFDTQWLFWAIEHDKLPHYAFVEPDYFWPDAASQHPSNNKRNGKDFLRGERLIRDIYVKLTEQPDVFAKTLFVITYDEHGGFFDRVSPPYDERYRDGKISEQGNFAFDLLGVRVPAVLVSPRIPAGTIDDTIYDHASIVATMRTLFAAQQPPLTPRDANANTFHHNVRPDVLRSGEELPRLPDEISVFNIYGDLDTVTAVEAAPDEDELDEFQMSLIWLTNKVEARLREEGRLPALERLGILPVAPPTAPYPTSTATLAARQRWVAQVLRASAPPLLTLRTPAGTSIENPSEAELARALQDLYGAGGEVRHLWLSHGPGSALEIWSDRRVIFLDRNECHEAVGVAVEAMQQLIGLYRGAELEQLRTRLGG